MMAEPGTNPVDSLESREEYRPLARIVPFLNRRRVPRSLMEAEIPGEEAPEPPPDTAPGDRRRRESRKRARRGTGGPRLTFLGT